LCDMQKSIATMLRFKMWPTDKHKKWNTKAESLIASGQWVLVN
jgi:hypothetical protein